MNIFGKIITNKYFQDTDTLYLTLIDGEIFETRDFDENTLIDLNKNGDLLGLTIEHAKERVDISNFSFQQIPTNIHDIKSISPKIEKSLMEF
jgi:uncharacterized protein YuzE